MGCLLLAVVAEALQFWIPLRDPSIRDVLALECGAVLGCGLWLATGRWVTGALCRLMKLLLVIGGPRLFHLRWLALFLAIFFVCLIVSRCASPIQLFSLYRNSSSSLQNLPLSAFGAGVARPQGLPMVLLVGALATLVIGGACRMGQNAVRYLKDRHSRP